MDLSTGCLSVLTTWQPLIPKVSDGRESEQAASPRAFYDLISKVTHCHLHFILFVRSELLSPTHTRGEENQNPLREKNVKESVDILKPPQHPS